MSETGLKIIIDAIGWIVVVVLMANVAFFFACLKIYTEVLKEKSQRARRGTE